jgi:hypothetical protein
MRRIVDADVHSLTLRLAGTFTPTEELYRDSRRAQELTVQLFERTRAAGAIRPDVEVDDLSLLFEQLAAVRVADEQRTRELRHRYLALTLDALRAPSKSQLPGRPPTWEEISQRWQTWILESHTRDTAQGFQTSRPGNAMQAMAKSAAHQDSSTAPAQAGAR